MTNRSINLLAVICGGLVLGSALSGCTAKGPGSGPNRSDSTSYGVPRKGAMDTTVRPAVVDTSASARSIPLDPSTGGLSLQGKGLYPGQWKFDDVAASLEETTRGGAPVSILTIQAHKVPPDDHFKLYFKRPAGQIEPGTYSIDSPQGSPPMQLDASWEHGRQVFRGLAGAKGSATINAVGNGRVKGTFDVSIVPLSGSGPPEVLTGSFDVKLGG